eukprot:scaffold23283_cov16-Prasinocladus_malaysianus.AAC.1
MSQERALKECEFREAALQLGLANAQRCHRADSGHPHNTDALLAMGLVRGQSDRVSKTTISEAYI